MGAPRGACHTAQGRHLSDAAVPGGLRGTRAGRGSRVRRV